MHLQPPQHPHRRKCRKLWLRQLLNRRPSLRQNQNRQQGAQDPRQKQQHQEHDQRNPGQGGDKNKSQQGEFNKDQKGGMR